MKTNLPHLNTHRGTNIDTHILYIYIYKHTHTHIYNIYIMPKKVRKYMHMHMYVFICIYIIYVCIYKIKKMNKEKRKISYNTFHIFVHKKFFFCFLVDDRILRYFFFCSVLFVNLFHLIVIICSCSAFKISYFDSNLGMWECQQIVINMS